MDIGFKVVDLGWLLPAMIVGFAGICGFFAGNFASHPRLPRAARWCVGVAVGLGMIALCSGLTVITGQPPERVGLLQDGEQRRLVVLSGGASRGGSHCTVRTYQLPGGQYLGGTRFSGDCHGRFDGAIGLFSRRGGLFAPRDTLAVDLWTGRSLGYMNAFAQRSLGQAEVQVRGVAGGRLRVGLQDGTERELPLPPASSAQVRWLDKASRAFVREGLLQARYLAERCGGRTLVTHRSVAFGDGVDRLSAWVDLDDLDSPPVWTVEPGPAPQSLLGVFERGEDCAVVSGRSGGRVEVLWIDGSGQVLDRWVN